MPQVDAQQWHVTQAASAVGLGPAGRCLRYEDVPCSRAKLHQVFCPCVTMRQPHRPESVIRPSSSASSSQCRGNSSFLHSCNHSFPPSTPSKHLRGLRTPTANRTVSDINSDLNVSLHLSRFPITFPPGTLFLTQPLRICFLTPGIDRRVWNHIQAALATNAPLHPSPISTSTHSLCCIVEG